MISLKFGKKSEVDRKIIVREFREKNLDGRTKIAQLDDWCKKYLPMIKGKPCSFNDVVEATPQTLITFKAYLDARSDLETITDELFTIKYDKNGNPVRGRCYVKDTLYESMKPEARTHLITNLNVNICPYCNRMYIVSDKDISTCQLDHFFSKDKYPIFATSFYNLIPSCGVCNMKKGAEEFFYYPYDYSLKPSDLMRFSYEVQSPNYLMDKNGIKIVTECKKAEYQHQMDVLELDKIYNHHIDIAQDTLKKKKIYSEIYFEMLCREFPSLFGDAVAAKELLYGIPLSEDEIGKRPMSKFLQDILED